VLSALQTPRTSTFSFFFVEITHFDEFRIRGLLVHFGARCSPLYDKGHPILGVFVHGRSFLEPWTPKVPLLKSPGDQKIILKKKKVIKTTPKKGHEHSLLRWPAGVKKKSRG
jgi:hypothetical protein